MTLSLTRTIPLLPDSIAVGLNDDLIQYSIELKFLLLFFEKPIAILGSTGLNFIPADAADCLRNGRPVRTNYFDENNIQHLPLVASGEWDELLGLCEPIYQEVSPNLVTTREDLDRVVDDVADDGLSFSQIEADFERAADDDERMQLLGAYAMRMELRRALETLELCCKRNIPMVWGVDTDLHVARRYARYFARRSSNQLGGSVASGSLTRVFRGEALLREIFDVGVVNMATVPPYRIVEFRNSSRDLLHSFLTEYRGFLVEVQNDPENVDKISQSHTQALIGRMSEIRQELLLLRSGRQYGWLRRLSEAAFHGAEKGLTAADWTLLLSPDLLLRGLGQLVVGAAQHLMGDFLDTAERERVILVKSNSGYLWKAKEEFGTKDTP